MISPSKAQNIKLKSKRKKQQHCFHITRGLSKHKINMHSSRLTEEEVSWLIHIKTAVMCYTLSSYNLKSCLKQNWILSIHSININQICIAFYRYHGLFVLLLNLKNIILTAHCRFFVSSFIYCLSTIYSVDFLPFRVIPASN